MEGRVLLAGDFNLVMVRMIYRSKSRANIFAKLDFGRRSEHGLAVLLKCIDSYSTSPCHKINQHKAEGMPLLNICHDYCI